VYGTLLDEGIYRCSLRTMYRVLKANHAVRERRDQLRHPDYKKPELIATAPNQVWSWDITKLLGPEKWSYFYLYVVLDIFSRYVVGWMLARTESAELARRLLRETCEKHGIEPGELVVHSDRGAPMTSKTLGQLLADLGVEKSLSRPHVSNDNPFSESAFKTLKYSPGFPDRFGGGATARRCTSVSAVLTASVRWPMSARTGAMVSRSAAGTVSRSSRATTHSADPFASRTPSARSNARKILMVLVRCRTKCDRTRSRWRVARATVDARWALR
jgi:putative transposase